MHIYLPIAELSASAPWLVLLGALTGIFAGMFGIGGGFILTPMLIFMGISPAVAVATSTNMIVASSFSGFLSHQKKKKVDVQMGGWLVLGGLLGVGLGIWWFAQLKRAGQIDLMISLLYITLLCAVAYITSRESWQLWKSHKRGEQETVMRPLRLPKWIKELPWQVEFASSKVKHSLLLPMAIGVASGILVALLGVGGGFLMIPAMVYILRMPLGFTTGTSLFQIIFITAVSTLLHALTTHSVDIVLAALLLMGSVIGTQWGVRIAAKIPTFILRLMMAFLLACVAMRLAYGLFITPSEIFTLTVRS
jgi:uncharacterized membrane protein YfcA